MKIVWTKSAKEDLKAIFDYYKREASSSIARKIKDACLDRVEILKNNPFSGPEEKTLKQINQGHRYLVEGNYKIVYRITKDEAYIVSIFDTRQNPQKITKPL